MNIVSISNNTGQGIRDFMHVMPVPEGAQRVDTRPEAKGQDAKPGFNDLLRDSADAQRSPKRIDTYEPTDAKPKTESVKDENLGSEKPEKVDQDQQKTEASENSSNESSDKGPEATTDEQTDTGNGDNEQAQTLEEAQAQAEANAVAAEIQALNTTQTQQPTQQTQQNNTQQVDTQLSQASENNDESSSKTQATTSAISANTSLPNQTQSTNGSTVQAQATAAVQPTTQQADADQAGSDGTQSDSKASTSAATTATSTSSSSNAASAAAFAVSDQPASEAKLPVNPATGASSADAAKHVQAQPTIQSDDHDSLNTARLTRGLANAVQQRGGAVTLRLTPPEMGTVRIQMQITGTSVSASFHAESASAQTLLTTQLAQLRSALESKGMNVERLTVQPLATATTSQSANQSQNQSQNDTQQQGQSQHSAGDGRSRGQYSGDSSRQQSPDQQQSNSFAQQARRGFFDRLTDAAGEQAA